MAVELTTLNTAYLDIPAWNKVRRTSSVPRFESLEADGKRRDTVMLKREPPFARKRVCQSEQWKCLNGPWKEWGIGEAGYAGRVGQSWDS